MSEETGSTDWAKEFYEKYYNAIATSEANAVYCERLYGKNLGQQGFAEISHLEHLIEVTALNADCTVLDLGCGNGMMAEFISDRTGAQITGIDFIPFAIEQAVLRTREKLDRLHYLMMDIADLDFPASTFDVVLSIDSLYFSDLTETLGRMRNILKPGGRMGIFYAQSWEPWTPIESYPREKVHPHRSDLATVLQKFDWQYQVWDYTEQDVEHARRKELISEELRPRFEAEGNSFLYENHIGEALGIQKAYTEGVHGRYLYLVTP